VGKTKRKKERQVMWKILLSRTFWFNVISGTLIVVDQLTGTKFVDPEVAASIVAVCNVILRFITTEPVSEKSIDK
jgi:hypothetical protein